MAEVHPSGDSIRKVREVPVDSVPALVHPEWREEYPWLVQGITTRGAADTPFDLGLFSGGSPPETISANWRTLTSTTGCERALHARQVHGSDVTTHRRVIDAMLPTESEPEGEASGPGLVTPCDGHVTTEVGLLLAVATADCVPVFAVDAERRAVGVFHAGWRGVVAGVVENGLVAMQGVGAAPSALRLHLGPSICETCYEVGPEVFSGLGEAEPDAPTPIDLRGVIAKRLIASGIRPGQVSVSAHCTRCTGSGLFSHRGGDRGRQVGFIGVRDPIHRAPELRP